MRAFRNQNFMVTWFTNLKKLIGRNDFSFQFRNIIARHRRIGYNLNVMRQYACLVLNPIVVDNYAAFFNCTPEGRASDSMIAATYILVGWGRASCLLLGPPGFNWCFSFALDFSKLFDAQWSPSSGSLLNLCVLVFNLLWWLS